MKTKEAEDRHKLYKNKLTAAMITAKKLYYTSMSLENKYNIKEIWEILNKKY